MNENKQLPINELSENELLIRYRNGDEDAFREVVNRYKNSLYTFLRRFTDNLEVVGYAFQETFLKLYTSHDSIDTNHPLLIIFKPFKAGDFIEAGGAMGAVKEIQIFNTILNSPDNKKVIIPNAQVTGGNIVNYSVNGTRRVDLVIGVSYDDDLKMARQVMEDVIKADNRVLADPAYTVAVSELGDSSVNFIVRPWVNGEDYWGVYFDMTEKIKVALEENGLSIPYPQRDVHMLQS